MIPYFCTNCGTPLKPEWRVCPECGKFYVQNIPIVPVYTPPTPQIHFMIKIIYLVFTIILVISLFLPYMHVSPFHYLYPDGNVYGYTTPFLLIGTGSICISVILLFSSKITKSKIFGLIGCGLILLSLYDAIYSTNNPPKHWILWLGIGFYIGLISFFGLCGSIILIFMNPMLDKQK